MRNEDLLRETPENGEENYTDNYKRHECNCRNKGIIIIKKKSPEFPEDAQISDGLTEG